MAEENQGSSSTAVEDKVVEGLKVTKRKGTRGMSPLGIEPPSLPQPEAVATKFYWCGVTKDCPFHSVTAGGFDFPAFTQKQEPRGEGGNMTILGETKFAGRVHKMTEGQVKWCLEGIANRILRMKTNKEMKPIHGGRKPFMPMAGDEPLAKYVYMIEIDDPDNVNYAYPAKSVTTLIPR